MEIKHRVRYPKGALCAYCHEKPVYARHLCKNCYSRLLRNNGKITRTRKESREYYDEKNKAKREFKRAYGTKYREHLADLYCSVEPKTARQKEILDAIRNCGSITEASKKLGISRQRISSILNQK